MQDFLLFLQVGESEFCLVVFAEVADHCCRIPFVYRMHRIQYVVVQHHILEISIFRWKLLKAADLFLLADAVDHSLSLGEHVIQQDLFPKEIHNLHNLCLGTLLSSMQ